MSDAAYLRSLADRREANGRFSDADFLRLMALYFEKVIFCGVSTRSHGAAK